MTDPADLVAAAGSPSHHFELLIGYVTDVTQDVQGFKLRKMDNMGDFIWADALSTKLGRITQLAQELKMGFDQTKASGGAGVAAKSSNAETPPPQRPSPITVKDDSKKPTTSRYGKQQNAAAAAAAASAAAHDAESIMSKEEEIENTLKAKNKEMMERRRTTAAAAVVSLATSSSNNNAPARLQNRPQGPAVPETSQKEAAKNAAATAARPRIQRPGPPPHARADMMMPTKNGQMTQKNGPKVPPKEVPSKIRARSKTPEQKRRNQSRSRSSSSRESTPKPPPANSRSGGRVQGSRGAEGPAGPQKSDDPSKWEEQPG